MIGYRRVARGGGSHPQLGVVTPNCLPSHTSRKIKSSEIFRGGGGGMRQAVACSCIITGIIICNYVYHVISYCWFSYMRPPFMYFNQDKSKSLHENRIQFPEDLSGTQSQPPFLCSRAPIYVLL